MKNKIILKVTSLVLTLAILITAIPVIALAEQTENTQQERDLYASTNSFIDYDSHNVDVPYFNKYQINSAGCWNYDNINISKENGFMSYSFSLFNLKATNDLNIDLGLRFDTDSSDISNEAKDPNLITNTYTVTETREYYKTSDNSRAENKDEVIIHENETNLYDWQTVNQNEKKYKEFYGVSYYYYPHISISANASDVTSESFNNFYDSRYNLGAGWSFNLPAIELVGTAKYFHTSDGSKYKINSQNKLEGYYLNDIIVNNAENNEFTVNSVQAKYRIINADGSKSYFDAQGKYIGISDKIGNEIKIKYYSNGLIERITESSGRYLKFVYENSENTRTVTGTLFDNTTSNPNSQRVFTINQQYDETNNCFKLTSINDAINRSVSFNYSVSENNIVFGNVSCCSKTLLLRGITNYNGAYLGIDYINKKTSYGTSGVKDYQAVSKCYKKENKISNAEKEVNTFNYQYENTLNWRFNENTCYPLKDGSTIKTTKAVKESSASQMRYESTINCLSRNIKDREYLFTSSDETSAAEDISTVEYSGFGTNNIPVVTLSKTLGENGNFLFTRSENNYDSYGNITSSVTYSGTGQNNTLRQYANIDSKSKNAYNYNTSKDIPVITAEYTKQDNSDAFAKVTFNTINNKNKITKSVVKTFNMAGVDDLTSLTSRAPVKELTETNYNYSSNGNLIKEEVIDLTTDSETTKKHTTKYTYDSKYSAYIARTEQTDIVNVNGGSDFNINGSPSIITKSNYDMFGNEIASFDAYSNKTISIYNEVGELIETQAYKTSPYKTLYDWENESVGASYPKISGFNTDTSAWSGNFTVIGDTSRLCSGSNKGIKIENKVNYNANCRVALNVPQNLMEKSLGMRFFAAPSKEKGGIKVSFTDYKNANYDVYTTADTKGGWIDISWNGRMFKNGVDVWEWTQGTVDDLRKAKTIWITFQNMSAGTAAYLDDIQILVDESEQGETETLSQTSFDYVNNITETINSDGTGSKTVTDNFGNTIKSYEKLPSGNYKLTSESVYDDNNRIISEKSYVTNELYTTATSEYNNRGELSKTTVFDQNNKKLSETTYTNSIVSLDNTLYKLSYEKVFKGTTDDNKTVETYTYNNASGQTVKTKTVNSFVDGDYTHNTETEDVNVYGSFGELLSNDNDESGKETYIQNSAGETVITGYEKDNNAEVYETEITDGFGQTVCETDANLNSEIDPDNLNLDNLDSDNGVLTKYDNAGRVIETKTPYENSENGGYKYSVEQKFYDANGNVIKEKTLIGYDENNNEIFSEKINTYDAKNNLIMIEQKNGNKSQFTQYYYDVNNRVIRIYSGLSKPLTFNSADNVITNGDDDYSVIKYTYDFYGNKSSYTDSHNKTETYQYNQYSGWLEKVIKRDGTIVTYEYDVNGNVISETAAKQGKATVKKTYTYDYDNNKKTNVVSKKAVGESSFADEYKTTYNNNENGAVYNEKTENFVTGNVINKAYQYDIKGNTTKLTVSKTDNGSLSQMYSYDYTYYDDGKLKDETVSVAGTQTKATVSYTYDNNGNVLTKSVSDNSSENNVKVASSFTYNLANECVSETHNNGTSYNYSYNYTPDGNVTRSLLSCNQKKLDTKYTYDKLNRLTSEEQTEYNNDEVINEFKDEYTFDEYNNITEKVHTETDTTKNTTVVSTYDKTRLSTQTENDNVITYTYDDNGNMSSKTQVKGEDTVLTEFSYDTFDRTESITLGNGVTTSFAYNADSDRVSKTTNGKATESILDNGSISADIISENNNINTNIYTVSNNIFIRNGTFILNAVDINGDIINTAVENEQKPIDGIKYNAYGIKLSKIEEHADNSNSKFVVSSNPIGYRNYYYDSETELYYLKARYYDPTTGQFTQEDTVQDDNLQYNLYGYCSANPVKFIDYSGHKKWYKTFKAYKKGLAKGGSGLSLSHYLDVYKEYKYNVKYIKNHKPEVNKNYIYDQYSDNVSGLHYGKHDFYYNGCGIAAVYNFLRYSKKTKKIQHIIKQFSLNGLRWFNGDWGTDPNDIKQYFDGNKIKYTYIKDSGQGSKYVFDKGIKDNKICIVSCWDTFNSWMIHTFAFYKKNKKYYAYNGYGSELMTGVKKYNSFADMTKNNIFICGYYSW